MTTPSMPEPQPREATSGEPPNRYASQPHAAIVVPGTRRDSQFAFDGGAGTYFGTAVLALLITVFTLGICLPVRPRAAGTVAREALLHRRPTARVQRKCVGAIRIVVEVADTRRHHTRNLRVLGWATDKSLKWENTSWAQQALT